jgi:hypothetical protein
MVPVVLYEDIRSGQTFLTATFFIEIEIDAKTARDPKAITAP